MPVFVEDPAQFSKQRLKLELVANNVVLPPGEKKKQVYLDLYMKNVFQKGAGDFSSDEEDQVYGNDVEDPSVQEEEVELQEEEEELDEMDVALLTDDELRARLLQFGVKAGPIVASSRGLYEKKLQRLLAPALQPNQNGTQEQDQYSDIEGNDGDEEEDEPGSEAEHPLPEPVAVAGVTSSKHGQLGSKRGPVPDVLTEMFPDTDQTLTGISATRRRPIKGAAGRPVQYKYPEMPLSPATMESIQLRQRLVPVWVQVLVFLGVAALLYLIYGLVEDGLESPIAALLDNLSPGAEPNEQPPPLPELQDNPAHLLPEEY